jgi:hypothetical protein
VALCKILGVPEEGCLGVLARQHSNDWGCDSRSEGDNVELPLSLFLDDGKVDAVCILHPKPVDLAGVYFIHLHKEDKADILPRKRFFEGDGITAGTRYLAYLLVQQFVQAVKTANPSSTLALEHFFTGDPPPQLLTLFACMSTTRMDGCPVSMTSPPLGRQCPLRLAIPR